METIEATERPGAAPGRSGDAAAGGSDGLPSWLPAAIVGAFAAAFYVVLALRSPVPVMWPDEFRYAHLARSLADGHGFAWRGEHAGQSAALYVYVLTPLWAIFHATTKAYIASKVLGTLLLCAQAAPVYLLARRLVGPRLAAGVAAVTLAGTWTVLGASLVTETLAMPLATAALCVTAVVLAEPAAGSRRGLPLTWLALGLALLAAWARIQLVALVPAILLALALDVARTPPPQRRERLHAHRAPLVAGGALVVVGVVVALAAHGVVGDYGGIYHWSPGVGLVLRKTGLELLGLVAAAGFAPVLLAAAAGAQRSAWRDPRVGPLLCVFWPAALLLALQAGFYLAGTGIDWWGIERYVVYAAPIAVVLAAAVVTDQRRRSPRVLVVAAVGALLLLLHPGRTSVSEERAGWATAHRVHQLLHVGTGLGLTVAALATLGVIGAAARWAPRRTGAVAVLVVGLVLVVQSQLSWQELTQVTRTARRSLPADLTWIDDVAGGPVAVLALTQASPSFDTYDFFNRDISQVYAPAQGLHGRPPEGRICSWSVAGDGTLQLDPGCGPAPREWLVEDPLARMTFHDEAVSVEHPRVGRLVRLGGAAAPRLRSLLSLACPRPYPSFSNTDLRVTPASAPQPCRPQTAGALWLDAPGTVSLTYRGGAAAHRVVLRGRAYDVAARRETTVAFHVAAGASQFVVDDDWTSTRGAPRLTRVTLRSGGQSSSLL